MKITARRENTYIPEWNGNVELPKEDQVVIHYRYLKTGERREYQRLEDVTLKNLAEEDMLDRKVVQDAAGITKAIVTKIENLILVIDGTEEAVETVEDFYDAPDAFPELRSEVESFLLNETAAVDSKN